MKQFLFFFIRCWAFLLVVTNTPSYAQIATQVVISQVYGGGGNSGATLRNDFIELYNPTSSAISLAGWSIQYASATGTTWSKTDLTGSIPAYGYYLIQQAQGAGGTTNLPNPDVIGTINMSGTAGKVALRNNNTVIATGTSCVTGDANTVDFVGFGSTVNCSEGNSPTPAPSNTNAVIRKTNSTTNNNAFGNAWDSNNNANDFLAVTPVPRNSSNFAPLFTTTPAIGNITATGFDLTVQTSKTGNVYVVLVGDGETAPSVIQVKNGQNAAGTSLDANLKATLPIATANTDFTQS
ncbi:MAG TPA: hypothetical protein DCM08_08430, partial [Microscillaceae bacterium]|nr:hypothetical protein [Microscillaceae bacterium]